MWTILKFDKKQINFLKKTFSKKIKRELHFFIIQNINSKYKKNKLINNEVSLLGDYILCFHEDFKDPITLQKLKFCRGLKYF